MSYSALLGGAERILLDFAGGLDGDVVLACPSGALEAAGRRAGLGVRALRPRRLELRASLRDRVGAPLRIAAQGREIRSLVCAERPRVVYGLGMRSAMAVGLALSRLRDPPCFVFQHGDFLPGRAVARAVRAAARRANRVVALSAAIAEDLDPGHKLAGGLEVVHPGVDLERFQATERLEGAPPEVLFLGAIEPWKRPDLALEIVALAAARLPELRATVAGRPIGEAGARLEGELRRRAQRRDLRGRVSFPGALADPAEALRRCSCLLHCADREPFGLVLVEALASARPVVAPSAGGPLEIVDERCGRLYEPGDAHAGADALVEVLGTAGRAEALGAAGRERVKRQFDRRRARERFAAVATSACAGP